MILFPSDNLPTLPKAHLKQEQRRTRCTEITRGAVVHLYLTRIFRKSCEISTTKSMPFPNGRGVIDVELGHAPGHQASHPRPPEVTGRFR